MVDEVLPSSWCWSTLAEVADPNSRAIVSGPFGSNIGRRFFVEKGVPVIRGNNLTTDMKRFVDDGFVFVTEKKADELGNCDAVVDDLVFTAAGSLGQVGIIPKTTKHSRYIISNKQLRARVDKRRVDPLFAFYWFSSNRMVEYIQQRNTGSSVPLINLSVLRSLPIPLPPVAEQRAIAHILGTLDDKIELNRRMNETLEAMARAIFTSWFVDFDPVRAKIEGRWRPGQSLPGLPAHLYDLFPDRLVNSELGEIPEGWEVGRLDDLLVLQRGFDLPKTQRTPGAYPVIAASGPSETHNEYRAKGPGVVTGRSGVLGRVFYVQQDFWPLNTTLWVKDFRTAQPLYAYHLIAKLGFDAFNAGSAVPTLNRNHVHGLPAVLPPGDLVEHFERFGRAFFQKFRTNDLESRTLAAVRDTLLPKLISGELRVKDAEGFLGRYA